MVAHRFHGLELPVRSCSGARAVRIVHPANQRIAEHRHDWPLLTLPAIGGYSEETDDGVIALDGPSTVLHPLGCCHANCVNEQGMETFSIEFDPDWLGLKDCGISLDRSHYWLGGSVALAGKALTREWSRTSASESDLRKATAEFVVRALAQPERPPPAWFGEVRRLAGSGDPVTTTRIAQKLNLHPAWLAQAYRLAAGEGLHATLRRKRTERAVHLLRTTDEPIADIALECGFCDQSHLNRAMKTQIGRTPLQVRAERALLDSISERPAAA